MTNTQLDCRHCLFVSKSNTLIVKYPKNNEDKPMVVKKSWSDFRESGLLWFVNTVLHMFGWAIVLDGDTDENGKFIVKTAYPARVRFRGFNDEINSKGYRNVTDYLAENIEELKEEADE